MPGSIPNQRDRSVIAASKAPINPSGHGVQSLVADPGLTRPECPLSSKIRRGPARRDAKTLNQGLGAVDGREASLYVPQPGVVGLGRVVSQGLLGVLQLLN